MKRKTPAAASGRGFGNSSGLATDEISIAPRPTDLQARKLLARFNFSDALAGAYAELAFSTADDRRGAR